MVVSFIKKSTTKKAIKENDKEKENIKTYPYCLSTIPKKATKCAYCASNIDEEIEETTK